MSEALAAPAARTAAFRGPRVLAAALLSNLVSVGCGLTLYGLFLGAVTEELHISQAHAGLGHWLSQIPTAAGAVVLGWWFARKWLRPVLLFGAACVALGLLALSQSRSGAQMGLVLVTLLGVGGLCTGPVATSALVVNWYSRHRGRALGIAAAGTTLGSALMPPIAAELIERFGWRNALALLGLGAAALLIPILWAWVVDRPESVGQAPDGRPATQAPDLAEPLALGATLRDPRLWIVALAFGLAFSSGVVMLVYTAPFAASLGFSLQTGAWLMSGRALAGALGKVVFGQLSDRIDRRALLVGMLAGSALLLEGFVRARSGLELGLLAGLIGFVSAPLLPLQQVVVSALFGRDGFPQVIGLLSSLRFPLSALSAPLFGLILDVNGGDHALAFRVYVGFFLLAALLLLFLRIPPPERAAP